MNIFQLPGAVEDKKVQRDSEGALFLMEETPYRQTTPSWKGRGVSWGACALSSMVRLISGLFFVAWQDPIKRESEPLYPSDDIQRIVTDNFTYNHVSCFKLLHGDVFHKRRRKGSEWEQVPLPSNVSGALRCIKADGANLIAWDMLGNVHYKKVLKEKRAEDGIYRFSVKALKNNWKKDWFTLPYLSALSKIVTGGKLWINPGDMIAISHRGEFSAYSVNSLTGKKFRLPNATTLYQFDKSAGIIRLHDPWVPKWVDITIPLPHSTHGIFEVVSMDSSASFLVLLGYKQTKVEGKGFIKSLSIFYLFVDLDLMGLNPLVRYGSGRRPAQDDEWQLSFNDWREVSLPDDVKEVYKGIRAVQDGPSSMCRKMILEGVAQGQGKGCFVHDLNEQRWQFMPLDVSSEESLSLRVAVNETVNAFKANCYQGESRGFTFRIEDYFAEALVFTLAISDGRETVKLKVACVPSYLFFIGIKSKSHIAYSFEEKESFLYRQIFGLNLSVPVSIRSSNFQTVSLKIAGFEVVCYRL